jgi:hypothetical protein
MCHTTLGFPDNRSFDSTRTFPFRAASVLEQSNKIKIFDLEVSESRMRLESSQEILNGKIDYLSMEGTSEEFGSVDLNEIGTKKVKSKFATVDGS